VIRGFCKRAQSEKDWKVFGSIEAFVGVLKEPQEIIELTPEVTGGIHVKGGTILGTTNKGNPIHYPTVHADGSVTYEDRSQHLVDLLNTLEFDA
ncbi:MAG: 6-phosphofructokinase, partial [Candidatus Nephrothrix sp. EaCA]